MRYIAAYVLSKLSGNESPSVADLKAVITAADGDFDEKQAETIVSKLKGQDVEALILKGKLKIGSLAPAPVASAAGPTACGVQAAKAEEKKAEEPAEESEEETGLASMFD